MYRVISIENNPYDEQALEKALSRYSHERKLDFSVAWKRTSGQIANVADRFDLAFIDIDLGKDCLDGMDFSILLRASGVQIPIVFVTSLRQFAVRGYEVSAVDYIVKPFSPEAFARTMERVERVLSSRAPNRVPISVNGATLFVSVSELSHVEVSGHKTIFHTMHRTEGHEEIVANFSMKEAEKRLPQNLFCRVDNSHLVNMTYITALNGKGVKLSDGQSLLFSRSRKAYAIKKIMMFMGRDL